MKRSGLPLLTFALLAGTLRADVRMPAIFSDHMVLAKAARVPVWGWAAPGEAVTVSLDGRVARATATADGRWLTTLDLQAAEAGPFVMQVSGVNTVRVSDVVVGEVWLASGQSNMQMTLGSTVDAAQELAASSNLWLREFTVARVATNVPLAACEGRWQVAAPASAGGFTAVGYYFGKMLHQTLQRPVGVINSSWGGTPSEAWTSAEALDRVPELAEGRARQNQRAQDYPGLKAAYVAGMGAWLQAQGRADRAPADTTPFTGTNVVAADWLPVALPGQLAGAGLPTNGAVWLRREIEISPAMAGQNLRLALGVIDGFESVYWNGTRLAGTTFETLPGSWSSRDCTVPAAQVRAGRAVLAIRLYAPAAPLALPNVPTAGALKLDGEWLARAEYALPALTAAERAAVPQPPPNPTPIQCLPATLFNGMIQPLLPYAIRGAIWYQGEANASRAWQYRTAFPLMITDWRARWQQGDFPFYFCQLANFTAKSDQPGDSNWAELRDAQTATLALPNSGQAVLIDIGESADIHPRNKRDAGERLARIALARDYGRPLPYSGPLFRTASNEPGRVRLHFTHTDGGLVAHPLPAVYDVRSANGETAPLLRNTPQSELEGFAICGADRKWVWAEARIENSSVVVSSPAVPEPVAVRYAWANNPTCNLYNGVGLPAVPFRTDDFPAVTRDSRY